MYAAGEMVVDIDRAFLESHGAARTAAAHITAPGERLPAVGAGSVTWAHRGRAPTREDWLSRLAELDVCSRRGLGEMFDSTIGAASALLPYGGRFGATPEEAAVAELPAAAFGRAADSAPVSALAYGFDPEISAWSPYHGAYLAVVESVCRLLAAGAPLSAVRLSLQEYFPRPGEDPERWGLPAAALLGALGAQLDLGLPAVGGKDSMSGSFNDHDVPPTLVSFAVAGFDAARVRGAAFSQEDSAVFLLSTPYSDEGIPDPGALAEHAALIEELAERGALRAAGTVRAGGLAVALTRACLGNRIGIELEVRVGAGPAEDAHPGARSEAAEHPRPGAGSEAAEHPQPAPGHSGPAGDLDFFAPSYGSFYLEVAPKEARRLSATSRGAGSVIRLGTTGGNEIRFGEWSIGIDEAEEQWSKPLSGVFPIHGGAPKPGDPATPAREPGRTAAAAQGPDRAAARVARPRVLIPVFPGTNCETDTARAFERAGAEVTELVFRNRTPNEAEESVRELAAAVGESQILALAGGFSAGDEPDGSGKYVAAAFRAPRLADAVTELITSRDGLILGICNGFQALVRLGLVPYGEIRRREPEDPILARNAIGRHVAQMVRTRVSSTLSPWLSAAHPEELYAVPVSHGEGRFVCSTELLHFLWGHGQIATQYVDYEGQVAEAMPSNPNGSVFGIEAVSSPDGRVLGKMGHSERVRPGLYRNFPETGDMRIFESGVRYFQ
jgi:phosphoribosylformylglycinamidine synthase